MDGFYLPPEWFRDTPERRIVIRNGSPFGQAQLIVIAPDRSWRSLSEKFDGADLDEERCGKQ